MTTGEVEAAAAPRADGSAATAPLARAFAAAVGSRILIFAAAFFAVGLIGYQKLTIGWRFPARAEVFHGALGHLLNPWAHWDGVWFIKIATTGYADGDGSTAFFPLYPMLLRWLGVLFRGNFVTTGIVISLVCYAGCVWLLYRLAKEDFDDGVASRAVIYLSIGPLSFFLQAVYTESLFLFLSLACFVCAREGRWRLAGLAGLLATLTRSTGVLLLIPMFYYYYEDSGVGPQEHGFQCRQHAHGRRGPAGVDDLPGAGLRQAAPVLDCPGAWSRFFAAPNYTVGMGFFDTALGVYRLLAAESARLFGTWALTSEELGEAASNLINLAFFVPAVGLLWYGARRLPGHTPGTRSPRSLIRCSSPRAACRCSPIRASRSPSSPSTSVWPCSRGDAPRRTRRW